MNLLDNPSGASLEDCKISRENLQNAISELDPFPVLDTDEGADFLAEWQHSQWIHTLLINSWSLNTKSTMSSYREDVKGDGVTLYHCFVKEYGGTSREALISAHDELLPTRIALDNFDNNIKKLTAHLRKQFRILSRHQASVNDQHWITLFNTLKLAPNEEFRIQILTWYKEWREGTSGAATWSMMQFLTKLENEYNRLVRLNQWKQADNSEIIALKAHVANLEKKLASSEKHFTAAIAANKPKDDKQPKSNSDLKNKEKKDKTDWKPRRAPKDNEPEELKDRQGRLWKYCTKCHADYRWKHGKNAHTTPEHITGWKNKNKGEANNVEQSSSVILGGDF